MHKLVVIDLSSADIHRFESYERQVLPLLGQYGGRLELCARSLDGKTETHLLYFPDANGFEAFLADPVRASLSDELTSTGAASTVSNVELVDYL